MRRKRTAIISIQKVVRGYLARRRLFKLWFLDEEKRREDASKKGAKKPPPKKGAPPPPPVVVDLAQVKMPSPDAIAALREGAVQRNGVVVIAMRQMFEEKWDDALCTLDAGLKAVAGTTMEVFLTRLMGSVQRRKNISLGLPPNAPPTSGPGVPGAKKKK
jgi:hypothetical protein